MSVLSVENKNAYYTRHEEVRTLLHYANELWGLDGKTALEPSVGSGAFPVTAERLGYYNLWWVTNELYPEQTNYQANWNQDFLELTPQPVDLVLGNPPYSGTAAVDGQRLPLWLAFVNQSLKWADRVAFVLPLQALKYGNLNRLAAGTEVVGWTTPTTNEFVLGGLGASEVKEVRTTVVFFERTGFPGYTQETKAPAGLEWVPSEDERATHGVSLVSNLGEARCLKGSWGRRYPFCEREPQVSVTSPELEALLAANLVHSFAKELCSALPALTEAEFNHYLNFLQKQLGNHPT